jgi:hypothetical protein
MVELSGIALLLMPDGIAGKKCFKNHLYGTFTAAKEKVVQPRRIRSAAAVASKPVPPPLFMDSDDLSSSCDGIPTTKRRRHRRRKKTRRQRRAVLLPMSPMSGMLVVRRVWRSSLCPIDRRDKDACKAFF